MPQELGWHSWRWPEPDGPLRVTVEFGVVEARAECVKVVIEAADSQQPSAIRSTEMRAVADQLKRIRAERRETLRRIVDVADRAELRARAERQIGLLEEAPKKRIGRPPLYDSSHYEEVARIYRSGGSTPTQAVREELQVSYATAGNWVRKARELGFLPKTSQGRVAGEERGEDR